MYIDVQSSMLSKVDYDGSTQKLCVVFKNGSKYTYSDVPQSIYNELINAESIGKYMKANVMGKYNSQKID